MSLDATQTPRERVVAAARAWLGTAYHSNARVKGAGVDCLTLLAEVYAEAGITPPVDIPYYARDWHLHRGEERYLEGLLRYTCEIEGPPDPGDIVLWKFGRCFSHAAIVVNWPVVIHAYVGRSTMLEDTSAAEWLSFIGEGSARKPRPHKFFSVFA